MLLPCSLVLLLFLRSPAFFIFFLFNDTATTEIYTLSLHDALPTCVPRPVQPIAPSSCSAGHWTRSCHGGWCGPGSARSEEHTSELQSLRHLVCRLLLEKKKKKNKYTYRMKTYHIYSKYTESTQMDI